MNEDLSTSLAKLLALEEAALASDEMRPLRLAREFHETDSALDARDVASTVVVFGSHLILSPEAAEEAAPRNGGEARSWRRQAAAPKHQGGAELRAPLLSQNGYGTYM